MQKTLLRLRELFVPGKVFTIRNITVMAMMVACGVVLSITTNIYITPQFRAFDLSYLPGAMTALLYGPYAALIYGLVSDTTKFLAYTHIHGTYFPGFAVSEMLYCFIYAIFLYKKPVSILRVALAQLVVTASISLGLNFVWLSMMYGTTSGGFFTGVRFIMNIIAYPIHVAIIKTAGTYILKIRSLNR